MRIFTVLMLGCLMSALSIQSQAQDKHAKHEQHKKEVHAQKYFELGYYIEALPLFIELDSIKPNNPEYQYSIGVCFMRSYHHEAALPYLVKAYELGFRTHEKPEMFLDDDHHFWESEDIEFNLARAYHLHFEFDKAIEHYELLIAEYEEFYHNHIHDHEKKVVQRYMEQCEFGKVLIQDTAAVVLSNLGVQLNSEYEEIGPFITADESRLFFTARNPTTTGGGKDMNDRYMEDIYYSVRNDDGSWGAPIGMGSKINTNEHDACAGLSPDGHTMFVFRNNHHRTGDLYVSYLDGSEWSSPKKMPEGINSKYVENSASITPDGKTFFFTSNRPGGHGGEDIYWSRLQEDGSWGPAKNLGEAINTHYDDDAPFIHPDGKTLYFSSKGHNSMGGYDIFKSVYDAASNTWGKPENLGYPINTPENDVFFVFSANGESAYFATHHEDSFGGEDLYKMTFKQKVSLILLKGKVITDAHGEPVLAKITVTDNETGRVVGEYKSNKSTGRYTVIIPPGKNYGVFVEAENCIPTNLNVDLPDKGRYYEKVQNISLQSIAAEKPVVTVLNNVFFDTDKADLRDESFIELDKYAKLLKENPTLQVQVAGHTDSDGDDEHNNDLSLRRAKSVAGYLAKNGVNKDRIVSKGYGETRPMATNKTSEGKQLNRRTELVLQDKASLDSGAIGYPEAK